MSTKMQRAAYLFNEIKRNRYGSFEKLDTLLNELGGIHSNDEAEEEAIYALYCKANNLIY